MAANTEAQATRTIGHYTCCGLGVQVGERHCSGCHDNYPLHGAAHHCRPCPRPAFCLGAQVRYRPYHRREAWPDPWHPEPWKVVGLIISQFLGRGDLIQYSIQPWVLTGRWMVDRPVIVFQDYLLPWPTEEQTPC